MLCFCHRSFRLSLLFISTNWPDFKIKWISMKKFAYTFLQLPSSFNSRGVHFWTRLVLVGLLLSKISGNRFFGDGISWSQNQKRSYIFWHYYKDLSALWLDKSDIQIAEKIAIISILKYLIDIIYLLLIGCASIK